jgi:hypothetical protein
MKTIDSGLKSGGGLHAWNAAVVQRNLRSASPFEEQIDKRRIQRAWTSNLATPLSSPRPARSSGDSGGAHRSRSASPRLTNADWNKVTRTHITSLSPRGRSRKLEHHPNFSVAHNSQKWLEGNSTLSTWPPLDASDLDACTTQVSGHQITGFLEPLGGGPLDSFHDAKAPREGVHVLPTTETVSFTSETLSGRPPRSPSNPTSGRCPQQDTQRTTGAVPLAACIHLLHLKGLVPQV